MHSAPPGTRVRESRVDDQRCLCSFVFALFCVSLSIYFVCTFAGRTPEQIRKLFGIDNDFTPAEESEVERSVEWATK